MTSEYDRRTFLRISALFGTSLVGGFFEQRRRDLGEIDFEEAANLSRFFDRRLIDFSYEPLPATQENLDYYVDLLYPLYVQQGFFDTAIRPTLKLRHLNGYSALAFCSSSIIRIDSHEPSTDGRQDAELLNPRYFPGAVAHELVHIHQKDICYQKEWTTPIGIEATAQIVRFEPLACLVRQNNVHALASIFFELREMSLNTALFLAKKSIHKFDTLLDEMRGGDIIRLDLDLWEIRRQMLIDDPGGTGAFFRERNLIPLTYIMNVSRRNLEIRGLALPRDASGLPRVGIFDDFASLPEQLQIP